MRLLVTGGAGFVGGNVAVALAALDNLRRRGSELNLPRLREAGVGFVHGDVRNLADLLDLPAHDAIVECSAEPSVMAAVDGSPDYVVQSNLIGAYHCLEFARRHRAQIVFLSTSRVYPVGALGELTLVEEPQRFVLAAEQTQPGVSSAGISEEFPLAGARTLYGATKLAAELLVEEYRAGYGVSAVINRCGVIAGPWQMGKVDQGVFTYWMLAHHFGRSLRYIGYGGTGKQVRDLLHVDDLIELLAEQLITPEHWDGHVVNVGGGRRCSLSLRETTALCQQITGNTVEIASDSANRAGDVPLYISDCTRLSGLTSWRPRLGADDVLADTHRWIVDNEPEILATL
jgi:CDP-paratose 2-epimerase